MCAAALRGVSVSLACRTFNVSETCDRYSRKLDDEDRRQFRFLDNFNREGLDIEVDFSLAAEHVIRSLKRIIEWRGKLIAWAEPYPARQTAKNTYIGRSHRTIRHGWHDQHIIETIEAAQAFAIKWLWQYNKKRPDMGTGGITPVQKLKMAA